MEKVMRTEIKVVGRKIETGGVDSRAWRILYTCCSLSSALLSLPNSLASGLS